MRLIFLLHSGLLIIGLGLIPVIILEFIGTAFPLRVWLYITFSGTFLAIYYLGIIQGYRSGDFTVVYPVARAIPVLLIAVADIALGTPPTTLGWLGILLVSVGLILSPLESLHGFSINRYHSKATLWTLLAAAGIS